MKDTTKSETSTKVAPVKVVAKKALKPTAKVAKKVAGNAVKPAAKKVTMAATNPAAGKPSGLVKETKPPKTKLVRDSFTMPVNEFALIAVLKGRAIVFARPTKKSELLRAGLQVLDGLSDAALKKALDGLTPLKAGRPKKDREQ